MTGDEAAQVEELKRDPRELATYLNQRQIPGVRVYPTSFTPTESNFKGVRIAWLVLKKDLTVDQAREGLRAFEAEVQKHPHKGGKLDSVEFLLPDYSFLVYQRTGPPLVSPP